MLPCISSEFGENVSFTTPSNLSGPGAASHTGVKSQSHNSKRWTDTTVPTKHLRKLGFSYTTRWAVKIYTLFKLVDCQKHDCYSLLWKSLPPNSLKKNFFQKRQYFETSNRHISDLWRDTSNLFFSHWLLTLTLQSALCRMKQKTNHAMEKIHERRQFKTKPDYLTVTFNFLF